MCYVIQIISKETSHMLAGARHPVRQSLQSCSKTNRPTSSNNCTINVYNSEQTRGPTCLGLVDRFQGSIQQIIIQQ
jgi:hypothetical protein